MEDRPVRLLEIAVARHTLELSPRFAPGVTVRAEVAPARPAIIRALLIGTELLLRVDSAAASSGEHEQWRWGGGRRWTASGGASADVTQRLVEEASKGFRGPLER